MALSAPRRLDLRTICKNCLQHNPILRTYTSTAQRRAAVDHLPRVAQTSFWASLIPKPLRRKAAVAGQTPKPLIRKWNPMTSFILLGLLVGSNAINLIALRNDMLNFSRKTDAKLALLREVIQKVKDGEEVDVKRALGTGDPKEEAEWEEVVKELESTDMLWEGRKKREAQRAQTAEEVKRREAERREGLRKVDNSSAKEGSKPPPQQRPKFLM